MAQFKDRMHSYVFYSPHKDTIFNDILFLGAYSTVFGEGNSQNILPILQKLTLKNKNNNINLKSSTSSTGSGTRWRGWWRNVLKVIRNIYFEEIFQSLITEKNVRTLLTSQCMFELIPTSENSIKTVWKPQYKAEHITILNKVGIPWLQKLFLKPFEHCNFRPKIISRNCLN